MTARHVRADNLGSLLRPPAVRAAYDEATATERRAIEDTAIEKAISHQERVGLPVITDGEFRRRHFFSTLLEVTDGLDPDGYVRRHRDEDGNWHEVRTPAPVTHRIARTASLVHRAATGSTAPAPTETSRPIPHMPHVCANGGGAGCTQPTDTLFVNLPNGQAVGVSVDVVKCTDLPTTPVTACKPKDSTS